MKKYILFLIGVVTSFAPIAAQETSKGQLAEYNRNSLASMVIYHPEDEMSPYIYNAFEVIPISDKYDDHNIDFRVIINDSIWLTKRPSAMVDMKGVDMSNPALRKKMRKGLHKAQYGKVLTRQEVEHNGLALEHLLNRAHIGKMMVAKWFGMDYTIESTEHPIFNTALLQQRGQYNATDLDVEYAKKTARGVATLSDAGEELLGNTYMLVNDITYVTAEERAAVAKGILTVLGAVWDAFAGGDTGKNLANMAGQIADSFTGFTVKTHSYLYQLQWNDSIASIFYNDYYSSTPDPEKLQAFLADTSSFQMKYVAHEYEFDGKSELKGTYDRRELVKMVCTRSIDKNIAALQLQYEDFKVKTPIVDVLVDAKGKNIGYTAKIGLKEGISEQSKFLVLQRRVDPETNRTTYRRIATLKPVRGKIWDNRYNAVTEEAPGSELTATTFKKVSGGEILPGMLIIEGEYKRAVD